MKTFKRIMLALFILIGTCALLAGAFAVRGLFFRHDSRESMEAYQLRYIQTVIDRQADGSVTLRPDASLPDKHTGIVFYPAASVQPEAYIPLLSGLCEQGYSCFVPKMPLNRADFRQEAAADVMTAETGIDKWFIGGHALGGKCAARFAADHSNEISGLIMLAAYPDRDLTDLPAPMLSVYGDQDTVMDKNAYQKSLPLNPAQTESYSIKGGNHTQFGDYGADAANGDTLSGEDQRAQTLQLIANWLEER